MSDNQNANQRRSESTRLRRELIVNTAIECFADKGFHQTSIRDIAQRAKVSLGNLYNYFDSKEALILEIAQVEAEDLIKFEKILADRNAPLMTIERFVNAYLKEVTQPLYTALAIDIAAEAMRNKEVAASFQANRIRISKALIDLLSEGIESKVFDPNLDCAAVAALFLDAIEGLGFSLALQGKKVSKKSGKDLLWNLQKIVRTI
ncbi:MAG: AcrR family transcriptional regulator [Saprospiraceae bacterium]|jgi:AcrR family transcriptional regulator